VIKVIWFTAKISQLLKTARQQREFQTTGVKRAAKKLPSSVLTHLSCLFWYWSITMQCWHSARVSTKSWCASHGCYECYAVWRIHRIILWMRKKATVKVKCTIGQNIYPKTMRPCPIAAGNIEHNSEKWLFWVFQVQWLHYNTGEVDKRKTAHVKFPPDFL